MLRILVFVVFGFMLSCSSTKVPVKVVTIEKKPIEVKMEVLDGWGSVQIKANFKNVSMYRLEVYNRENKKISTVDKGTIICDGELLFYWEYQKEKINSGEYTIKLLAENYDDTQEYEEKIVIGAKNG